MGKRVVDVFRAHRLSVGGGVIWTQDGACCIKRQDDAYRITRSPQEGFAPDRPVTLVLIDCNAHRIINGRRDVANTPAALAAAYNWLKGKVDA